MKDKTVGLSCDCYVFYWLRDYGSHDNINNNVMILAAATIYQVFIVLAMLSCFLQILSYEFGDIISFL